jgi:hypothetical protein
MDMVFLGVLLGRLVMPAFAGAAQTRFFSSEGPRRALVVQKLIRTAGEREPLRDLRARWQEALFFAHAGQVHQVCRGVGCASAQH